MTFEEELHVRTEGVEEIIRKYLPEEQGFQKTIFKAVNYSVKAGGKRLRPLIMQEMYHLFDGHGKVIEPFMAAMEYMHTSSLIHDDLPCMDNDELRRGKKTTWKMFGEDMGVLAGDALMIYAFEVASAAFSLNSNASNVGRAIGILAEKSGIYGMVGGQTLDVEKTGNTLKEDELDFIYSCKTGALLEASFMIGAVLADASKEDIRNAEQIAQKIGFAFQIQDDILDLTSTNKKLGKNVRSDEKNNKTTYVTLYGIDAAKEKVKSLTDEAVTLLHSLNGENPFLERLLISLVEREK